MAEIEDQSPVSDAPVLTSAPAQLRWRDDAAYDGPVAGLATLADGNATAVRLQPGDDARALAPHLARLHLIEIAFPKFRDGRGYSAARILRELGFTGELRAIGDILVDQLTFLRRCGIDGVAPDQPLDPAVVERTLARYPYVYQRATDDADPIWALRHG